MTDKFQVVGIRPQAAAAVPKQPWHRGRPVWAMAVLGLIVLGCLIWPLVLGGDAGYMDLANCNAAPGRTFWFGTDTMGRDLFKMIWAGGRVSLTIGVLATAISTVLAIVIGAVSGCGPQWLDTLVMRGTEIFLSIPNLLLVVFLQAILGTANVWTLSLVLGVTGWPSIAKVVRTEVRQLRGSEYVLAARSMGGGFFYVLRRHLTPNFLASIVFMVVMNVRSAMLAESTLSFMGLGLPLEVISWGSMLSLAEKALMTRAWWIIAIPGVFLVAALLCITELGNDLRRRASQKQSNL